MTSWPLWRARTGWDLHEWRHCGLTHLGEARAALPMLMTKSRHKPLKEQNQDYPAGLAAIEILPVIAGNAAVRSGAGDPRAGAGKAAQSA